MSPELEFREKVSNELTRTDERLDYVMEKIASIEKEQCLINEKLSSSSCSIERVQTNTQDMLTVFESWRGAMKVLEWIGKLAKPLVYIVGLGTAILAAYTSIKSGVSK